MKWLKIVSMPYILFYYSTLVNKIAQRLIGRPCNKEAVELIYCPVDDRQQQNISYHYKMQSIIICKSNLRSISFVAKVTYVIFRNWGLNSKV